VFIISHWSLVIGHWSLVIGHWPLGQLIIAEIIKFCIDLLTIDLLTIDN